MKSIQNRSTDLFRMMPALWYARLEALANAAEVATPADAAVLLRRLHDLLGNAPHDAIANGPRPADIEALLASGGETSAALALLPTRAAWMMSSRAEGDLFLATLLLPGMIEDITGQVASAALALVSAIAMAVAGGSMMIGDDAGPDPRFA